MIVVDRGQSERASERARNQALPLALPPSRMPRTSKRADALFFHCCIRRVVQNAKCERWMPLGALLQQRTVVEPEPM